MHADSAGLLAVGRSGPGVSVLLSVLPACLSGRGLLLLPRAHSPLSPISSRRDQTCQFLCRSAEEAVSGSISGQFPGRSAMPGHVPADPGLPKSFPELPPLAPRHPGTEEPLSPGGQMASPIACALEEPHPHGSFLPADYWGRSSDLYSWGHGAAQD